MGGMGDARNAVDWNKVKSRDWRQGFESLTNDLETNALVRSEALRILEHRNNSDFEDLSIVSRTSGSVIGRSTGATRPCVAKYTEDLKRKIMRARGNDEQLIAIHNHPNSWPPSGSDIISYMQRGYSKSVIACHDGNLHVIEGIDKNLLPQTITARFAKHRRQGYNEREATDMLLQSLVQDYRLRWRRLL
jgi:hypothetical protein